MPVHRPSDFHRIALRATGGRVKAIFWHLGVRCALEERGFTFTSGLGPRATPSPGEIGLMIGSSAGSISSLLIAAGYDIPEILASFLGRTSRMPPIRPSTIFRRRTPTPAGYFRRLRNAINLRAGQDAFPEYALRPFEAIDPEADDVRASKKITAGKAARYFRVSDLLDIRAPYVLSGMESWLQSLVPGHDRFEDLRAALFFIASDLDAPRTTVFSTRSEDRVWYRYVSGVPLSRAAACSMAIPSVFNPLSVNVNGKKEYFIDGDVYNPTETMIEQDHACDLAIVSSFEAPYRLHPAIGSLHHLGLPYEVSQTIALTIYSRFIQSRATTKAKSRAMSTIRDVLAKHLDEESLEKECRRIAAVLETSIDMKVIYLHPFTNPLMFFGNPYDLSIGAFAKMLVEATQQAGELLKAEGF